MLQRLPSAVGRALRRVRPGVDRFICRSRVVGSALPVIEVTNPGFGDQQPIPVRYTADGDGISPPLAWGDVPEGTRSIAPRTGRAELIAVHRRRERRVIRFRVDPPWWVLRARCACLAETARAQGCTCVHSRDGGTRRW